MWLRNGKVTSASGFTININGLGAKPCYSSLAAASRSTTIFNVNYALLMIYNSTRVEGGCWDIVYGVDTNTTYTPPKLGFGYGTCTTAAATAAKTASISSYALTTGGIVSIKFDNDVPAGSTLNITSKGAKAIYHRGAAITAGVIKAGDTATFIYSTYYHLISVDRDESGDDLPSVTASDNGKVLGVVNGAWAVKSDEGGASVTVDDALSDTSENPVQNKVVKAALDGKQDTLTAGQNVTISGNTISADVDSAQIASSVSSWLDTNVNPVGSAVVVDSSLTIEGAAADAKAVGDKLVKFNSARNGLVPASGVKSDKKYYLAGNGKFEKIPFDSVACQNLITILQSCICDKDVSINISNLAEALGINSGGDGDEMTFQFGQSIPKGSTSRTLTGLEQFQMTEIRLVVALHSNFQQGAFCLVSTPSAGSPYLGISSTGDFYYSNQGSYSGYYSATPANLVDFVGSEPKEVKIQYLNPSGWESRKYISNLKFFFNAYNPSCGFTLFQISGYDGATKLFNLESTGTNGELYDTMTGTTYTFDNTSGMEIVEVEEE
jgi:hypothetical protein